MINIEQDTGNIKISYFNKEGEIEISTIPIENSQRYDWVDSIAGKYDPTIKSWDNKRVKKSKSFYLSNWRVIEIMEMQPQHVKDKIYQQNEPKKFFLDIETEVIDGFPDANLAKEKIQLIQFAYNDIVGVLGFKELKPEAVKKIESKINEYLNEHDYPPIKFMYIKFESEYDMLYAFFHKYIQKMPLISGWNVIDFDWKFLINRAKRLEIDPGVASLTGKLIGRDNLPVHRLIVDYMEIYKKWDKVVFKENNTLDYVAKAATGMGKIKYSGSLQQLYEEDFFTYVHYGAIDPILVKLIDQEISTINVYFALSDISYTPLYRVFSPIAMTENVLVREFLKRGKVVPNRNVKPKKAEYEGAYVFTPKSDLYEWVASFDFASLYPSIMRQWNMSPESFREKNQEIKKEIFENINENLIAATTGAIFDKDYDSAFRTVLSDFYGRRKSTKQKMKEVDIEIQEIEKMLQKN
jgi:DNA polymerase elongation subunit (family B)